MNKAVKYTAIASIFAATTLASGAIYAATSAPTPSIVQLTSLVNTAKRNLDSTKAALDTAKANTTRAASLVTTAQTTVNTATAKHNSAIAERDAAISAFMTANSAYASAKPQTAALKAALTAANTVRTNKIALVNSAAVSLRTSITALNRANTALKAADAILAAAQKNYDTALTAFSAAQNNLKNATLAAATPIPTPTPTPKPAATTAAIPTIDVMVLYTTETTTAEFAKQRIQYLISTSNQSYKDSGINLQLRLVYTEKTTYPESVSNSKTLTDLSNANNLKNQFTGVHGVRAKYGADLVLVFRPLHAKTQGNCGVAYIGFSNGTTMGQGSGYGVISDGTSKDSVSNAFCQINTFAHEIGHNLGLVHERENANSQGAFAYSYAWGIAGKFGTIMSYKAPVVMLYSSPDLATNCAGAPCGYPESDTAKSSDQVRSVNLTAQKVADYFPRVTETPVLN